MTDLLKVQPVILCGGSGTRLWPLSRAGFPKQFLCLTGEDSLFQQAAKRLMNLETKEIQVANPLIVTGEEHRFLAAEQLRESGIEMSAALLEPMGRNTAPALTLAALAALESGNDPILLVTPADQTVANAAAFTQAMHEGICDVAVGATVSGNFATEHRPRMLAFMRSHRQANMKKALICGVSGQDGAYLSKLLLGKGYRVWGTSRDAQMSSFANLDRLGIRQQVQVLSMAQSDFRSVLNTLSRSDPDEIYFLSGQSSVGLSFDQPAESIESIALGALNLLEAVRFLGRPVRIYHASSSECFGDVPAAAKANEMTPFRPRSPYGVAKASAHWLIANYREAYGLYCCNGILFNHESPLRPARFVTRKIVAAAYLLLRQSQTLNQGSQGSTVRRILLTI